MIYTSDPQAIRDAKKDVGDAKLEIQKQSIQDQIDALDDEIDKYNDLIDQINKAADTQIAALEKIKNKWQEVIDQQEYAKNLSLLIGEFGADAITKILTGNDDDLLAQWKEDYINTLADIDMESQGYIGDMIRKIAGLYNVDLSPLQNQFQNVKESVDGVGVAADESLPVVTSYIDDIGTSAMNAASAVSFIADVLNSIPEEKDVTINVHTSGIGGSPGKSIALANNADFTGKAYADGNEGLEHDEKNALRSEYGQTELTVYPDGKTELTTQPIMSDLPKGTVIYNEEQTKKIMNAKPQAVGNAHANGTNDGNWWIGSDGHRYRDLQPGDRAWELQKAFEPLLNKWLNGEMEIISNAMFEGQKQMERLTKEITNNTAISNIVNNNKNIQQPVVNHINVTCPGVTSQEVAKQLPGALDEALNRKFNGFSTYADQWIRR